MNSKNKFAIISCSTIFCFTFTVSMVAAQIVEGGETTVSDAPIATCTGTWRSNTAESDDMSANIGKLKTNRSNNPSADNSGSKEFELPDALILARGGKEELTINEIFKRVIKTRTFSFDGIRSEYETGAGVNLAIVATRKSDEMIVETISSRHRRTETFRVSRDRLRLILIIRIEDFETSKVINLYRLYDREPTDSVELEKP